MSNGAITLQIDFFSSTKLTMSEFSIGGRCRPETLIEAKHKGKDYSDAKFFYTEPLEQSSLNEMKGIW